MRLLSYQEGTWHRHEDLGRDAARDLALGPVPVWVRAEGVPHDDFKTLAEWFDIHPLALEDILNVRQRPKVEDYPGMTFVVARVPRYREDDLEWVQVGVFLGQGFVLTATPKQEGEPDLVPELESVESRYLAGGWQDDGGQMDRMMYHILDALVDSWFPYMDDLEDTIDDLEHEASLKPTEAALRSIRQIKRVASRTRKVSQPMREAMLNLERQEHPNIHAETRIYLRDVSDHMVRIAERLEHVKEMALIGQETWNATLANQQNMVMKRLTVIAALLLFPGLMAGLGGMNFEDGFPQWGYWTVTAGIFLFIVAGLLLAWWRKWL